MQRSPLACPRVHAALEAAVDAAVEFARVGGDRGLRTDPSGNGVSLARRLLAGSSQPAIQPDLGPSPLWKWLLDQFGLKYLWHKIHKGGSLELFQSCMYYRMYIVFLMYSICIYNIYSSVLVYR